jgi:hypothetical protein
MTGRWRPALAVVVVVVVVVWTYLLLGAGIEKETMDIGSGLMMAMAPEWPAQIGTRSLR